MLLMEVWRSGRAIGTWEIGKRGERTYFDNLLSSTNAKAPPTPPPIPPPSKKAVTTSTTTTHNPHCLPFLRFSCLWLPFGNGNGSYPLGSYPLGGLGNTVSRSNSGLPCPRPCWSSGDRPSLGVDDGGLYWKRCVAG